MGKVRSRSSFEAFRQSRLRSSNGPIRITYVEGGPTDPPCVAYAIGRKVGGAVVRNRLRRRLRAINNELSEQLQPGDYLIAVSARATELSYGELRTSVRAAVAALFERSTR